MGVELHPWGVPLPSFPAGEALSANMVVMVTTAATYKATAGAQIQGVTPWDVDLGDPPTLQCGLVNVLTSAGVAADAAITVSATAGKVRTATAGEVVIGKMIDTVAGAGTGRAMIFPPGVGATALGLPSSGGSPVAQIADATTGYGGGCAAPVGGTITTATVRFLGPITHAAAGVFAELYRVRAGVATLVASDTHFAAADADYVALADWALTLVGGAASTVVAGDQFYLQITNNTGAAIDPYVAWVALA